jgi:hypothetical protein
VKDHTGHDLVVLIDALIEYRVTLDGRVDTHTPPVIVNESRSFPNGEAYCNDCCEYVAGASISQDWSVVLPSIQPIGA